MNHIERIIAAHTCKQLIAAGYLLTVDYSRGFEPSDARDTTDTDALLTALDAVDEAWLMVRRPTSNRADAYDAFVYFIWSNGDEGRTCISDWSGSLTPHIEPWYMDDNWLDGHIARAFAALDALTALLDAMETPRSARASKAWDAARRAIS